MNVIQFEKVFLTANEINIIAQFETLIEEINYRAQSKGLCEVCDNILIEVKEELIPCILPEQ